MSHSETLTKMDRLSDQDRECIEICNEAAQVCEWCADACADEEGMGACVRLCRDVADIASLHARLVARNSEYSDQLAEVCAGVCEECAEECDRHDADHCQQCTDVLRECADHCRSMIEN